MTDIGVTTISYQAESRSWIRSQWGQGPGENPSVTLLPSLFTANTHFPNGFIKSGQPLGRVTASGLVGPYDDAASDGRQTCIGFLHSSVKVPDTAVLSKTVGGALVAAGFIKLDKLPVALDANGQADLKLCHFTA